MAFAPRFSILVVASLVVACGPSDREPGGPGLDVPGRIGPIGGGSKPEAVVPPPISGGTLLVTSDLTRAFVSDPDRGRVLVVDLDDEDVIAEIDADGAEPGRAVEDAAGRVHVVLRRAGTVVTLGAKGNVLDERDACPAPRGIAFDSARDEVLVACAGGELVRLPTAPGGEVTGRVELVHDLRDVVVSGPRTFVSTFRSAEVLLLDDEDAVERVVELPSRGGSSATVAWRMTAWPGFGVFVAHQRSSNVEIEIGEEAPPDAYGAPGAAPVVESVGTGVGYEGEVVERAAPVPLVLPVDGDVGAGVAMVGASSDVLFMDGELLLVPGEPIAVRWRGAELITQQRNPAALVVFGPGGTKRRIDLGGKSVADAGHATFHRTPDGPVFTVSCATCHPEGRDDGHVWSFDPIGPRRTQSLLGGLADSAPFHWDGDLDTLDALLDEVFTFRMGNRSLAGSEKKALAAYIDALEPLPSYERGQEIAAGRAAFEKADCHSCHGGERFTNFGAANVGTGGVFQVPSLVGLRYRAPYMHDGCADTIADRFGPCGGLSHGDVSKLDDGEVSALVDYLTGL